MVSLSENMSFAQKQSYRPHGKYVGETLDDLMSYGCLTGIFFCSVFCIII